MNPSCTGANSSRKHCWCQWKQAQLALNILLAAQLHRALYTRATRPTGCWLSVIALSCRLVCDVGSGQRLSSGADGVTDGFHLGI